MWLNRKNALSCEKCKNIQRRLNLEPPCDKCKIVKVLPENNIIIYIINMYGGVLTNGMGGISADGIRLVLDTENIEDRELITQKLIIYLSAALNTQHKERADGREKYKT